jgi:hypothetical protein
MKAGNVFATKRIEQLVNNGSQTWSAGKNRVYICLLLGIETTKPKSDADLIQPSDVLKMLGWKPPKKGYPATLGVELGELIKVSGLVSF